MKGFRRILSVLMVVTMLVTLLPVLPTEKIQAASKVYYIYTVEDLYCIRNDLSGTYYLMNDLDLTKATAVGGDYDYMGNGWDPIGSYSEPFSGKFDGGGRTIKGLRCRGHSYAGLFANVSGTIKDLSISGSVSGQGYTGAIAAYCSGKITNCKSSVFINVIRTGYVLTDNSEFAGGIVGYLNNGEIDLCSNNEAVQLTSTSRCEYSGGIAGGCSSKSSINRCYNTANIVSKNNCSNKPDSYDSRTIALAGGICGYEEGSVLTVQNCYNTGKIISQTKKYDGYYAYECQSYGISRFSKLCYNIGSTEWYREGAQGATSESGIGYAIGQSGEGCYFLSGTGNSAAGCYSLSNTQMKLESMYSKLDFSNIWIMDSSSTYKYPQLQNNRQVTSKEISSIEILTYPNKLKYYTEDELDLTGGTIKVYYIDGSSKIMDMENVITNVFDDKLYSEGKTTVRLWPDFDNNPNQYISIIIEVVERPSVTSLTLISEPNKKEFIVGTTFDFSGCQVQIAYDNGDIETKDITADMTWRGDINKVGLQYIYYTVDTETFHSSVSFAVNVIPLSVKSIWVERYPNKINYIEGNSLSIEGLSIKALYNDNTTKIVTDYTYSGYSSEPGTHTITVEYSGCTTTFDVTVAEKTATAIKVTKNPTKTSYIQGQKIDSQGMVVTATYDNGTAGEITDYTIDTPKNETGLQTVAVRYGKLSTYIPITVIARQVENLEVSNFPNQTTYIEGTEFNPEGLVVQATFNDGLTEEVTDYELSDVSTNTIGEKEITVIYGGKSATFTINVIEKSLESISVSGLEKKSYLVGEDFDTKGMIVTANYDNKTREVISDYEISGYNGTIGSNLITVSYQGKNINFYVTVHEPEKEWQIVSEPDCKNAGKKIKHCTDCGEIVLEEEIKALGHTVEVDKAIEPTCTETGLTEGSHCSVCETVLIEQEEIPAKGHILPETWTIVNNPLCLENGLQERCCLVCGKVIDSNIIEAHGHHIVIDEAIGATCTESGHTEGSHCDICNEIIVAQKIVEPLGHTSEENWTVIKEATCTKEGKKVKHCSVCGETLEEEPIEALGHSFIHYYSDENATCTEDGTKTATCKRCDVTNTVVEEGSRLGHQIVLDKAIPPTCTESGLTEGTHCERCHEILKHQEVVAPKGHRMSERWVTEIEATCTEKGLEVNRCVECDEVLDTRKTEALGHALVEDKAVAPTCTKPGLTKGTHCSTCGEVLEQQKVVEATGHQTSLKNVVGANYLNTGYTGDEICDICGEIIKKGTVIPNLVLERPSVTTKLKKNNITVSTKKIKDVNYYEYRIKIGSKWKTYKKTKNKYTFKKLKKGKKYTIKLRTIKVEKGVNVYSKWSKSKKVKVKK